MSASKLAGVLAPRDAVFMALGERIRIFLSHPTETTTVTTPEIEGSSEPGHEHAYPFVPLRFSRLDPDESLRRAASFYDEMNRRRTTRHFATDPVPRALIELAIRTAGTAPSGAHQQPWTFVAISDRSLKQQIRAAAEAEERDFYHGKAPPDWLEALRPLGTDEHKPHLTDAPWVVVLFRQAYGITGEGGKRTHYYTEESCGIAAGLFIAAVHHMGLVTLTHTPNPMGFLRELLGRPVNERAMLVMPVGYPAADARVPDLTRKALEEIAVFRPTSQTPSP